MKNVFIYCLYIISLAFNGFTSHPNETFTLSIFFPQKRPNAADSYLCTSISVENFTHSNNLYIQAFTPVADMEAVHHMLLYGCFTPGITSKQMWSCGNMLGAGPHDDLPVAGICSKGTPQILYAWARNAPKLTLPNDVAFQLGGNTGIHSLVLQFHTGRSSTHQPNHIMKRRTRATKFLENILTEELLDIGLIIHVSKRPSRKLAGVYLLKAIGGVIPPNKTVHLEMACLVRTSTELHPFAFRTHSHSLGKVISGYRVRSTGSPLKSNFEWTMIGKKDPQLPQMFYPVENDTIVVRNGDILAARCTMISDRSTTTKIGPTAADEMCNFYIMYYYVENSNVRPLEHDTCVSSASLNFWKNSPLSLNNFPADASIL